MIYFTADHHFGHRNIIRPEYCGATRPFQLIEQHDLALLNIHNEIVDDDDDVYMLGDIALNASRAITIVEQMKGRKHLIVGNHDPKKLQRSSVWESVCAELQVAVDGVTLQLQHHPSVSWRGKSGGALLFHGHSHGAGVNILGAYDVGVDCWQLRPVTMQQVIAGREWQ